MKGREWLLVGGLVLSTTAVVGVGIGIAQNENQRNTEQDSKQSEVSYFAKIVGRHNLDPQLTASFRTYVNILSKMDNETYRKHVKKGKTEDGKGLRWEVDFGDAFFGVDGMVFETSSKEEDPDLQYQKLYLKTHWFWDNVRENDGVARLLERSFKDYNEGDTGGIGGGSMGGENGFTSWSEDRVNEHEGSRSYGAHKEDNGTTSIMQGIITKRSEGYIEEEGSKTTVLVVFTQLNS